MSVATSESPGRSAAARLVPVAGLLILIAVTVLGYFAITSFNLAVEPELNNRSRLIGMSVRDNVERALELGVPLDRMAGTGRYLIDVLGSFPEVARISIRDTGGTAVAEVARNADGNLAVVETASGGEATGAASPEDGAFRFAILAGNTLAGEIVIEVDREFVEQQFTDVFLDVAVVVLVVLLLAFEITLAAVSTSLSKPLDTLYLILERQSLGDFSRRVGAAAASGIGRASARFSDHAVDLNVRFAALLKRTATEPPRTAELDGQLEDIGRRYRLSAVRLAPVEVTDPIDIRLPLFLFAAGEELSKPFLPLLVRSAASDTGWLSQEVLISLPLIAYLLALIALSPVAGRLVERFTPRTVFLAALLPVVISHVGLSVSSSVAEFVLWRGVAGAGYALATIACQEYALRTATGGRHGRATGGFVMVVIGGTFCGTALGGVLADRLGPSNAFLIGAALVAISGLLALKLMARDQDDTSQPVRSSKAGVLSAFVNARFVALLFGVAIPANILMAAFLWYLVPLALADLGSRPADIGRVLMAYYLITVLAVPWAARFIDRFSGTALLAMAGGTISGLALVGLSSWYGLWPIVAAVAAAGVGHALIRAVQVSLAISIAATGSARTSVAETLGALRMWERAGSVVGLLLTAFLVGRLDYAATAGLIGWLVVVGALAFFAVELADARRRRTKKEEGGDETP